MDAKISLEYSTPEFARSIMKAINPDNITSNSDEMKIGSEVRGRRLNVAITGCKRIETLEATVQDVFRCIRAAEESLEQVSTNHKTA